MRMDWLNDILRILEFVHGQLEGINLSLMDLVRSLCFVVFLPLLLDRRFLLRRMQSLVW